jgi:hypothetical protein
MKAAPQRVVAYLDLAALEAGQKRWSARQKVLTRGLSALPNHPALLQALQARME